MRKEIYPYQRVPKYYGVAWYDIPRNVGMCYPIPLNFLMGWMYLFYLILKNGPSRLIYKVERFLKEKPKYPTKIYKLNGIDLYWHDFDRRVVCGHSHRPKIGEGFSSKMQSGKVGVFRVKDVRWCGDPSNMYFADVEDVGYEK